MEMSVEHMSVGAAGVDDLACYRVEVAPIYQCLRQVLIQLAGLAILAQGRQSAGWPDHPTLTAAGKRLKEAFDGVNSVRVPNAVSHSHVFLGQCVADLQWVLERMLDVGEKALEGGSGSGIAHRLDHAYRTLRHAANEQLGFAVVDMRQSCCCLGSHCGETEGFVVQANY
jgi:hypothetical protein